MAFNFNWSPLTADETFYARAQDLLTTALNKNPKPPIIVDDILVSELNLGTVPPDLEILEIGDLAEDRFRGIFKMSYNGDAYLTLKTRVQANPMNTYLYSKPSFTSPQPLAAASGLTIPLSITLSDIKLSAFIILVFSKQKGLTIVFRNDPLESLKVSSTFDSIQFVRDYLQRTIEQQLRNLMMDELPAIIHRLSVQFWSPEQASKEAVSTEEDDEAGIDPFASPPLDPVDAHGNVLDPSAISELTLNGSGEMQSLFSQRNLVRLASLTDSNRTLSLFTPSISDVVFRAWPSSSQRDRAESPVLPSLPSVLTKTYSFHEGGSTTYTFSDSGSASHGYAPSRAASHVSLHSLHSGIGFGASRARVGRKKKTRVVNMRKAKSEAPTPDILSEHASDTASVQVPSSEPMLSNSISEESESEFPDPETVVASRVLYTDGDKKVPRPPLSFSLYDRPTKASNLSSEMTQADLKLKLPQDRASIMPKQANANANAKETGKIAADPGIYSPVSETGAGSSNDKAWVAKMAGEIARRVYDEKRRHQVWDDETSSESAPPPAYEAATRQAV